MQKRKKLICVLLAAAMLPAAGVPVYAGADDPPALTEQGKTAPDTAEDSGEETYQPRTEQDVFAKMKKAAENDRLEFWVWDEEKLGEDETAEDLFALVNKKTGYVWWSSPINAGGDPIATPVLRSEIASAMVLTAAQTESRSTVTARSGDSLKTVCIRNEIDGGIEITYNFKKQGIKIPVRYVLEDDHLSVSIDTSKITEKNDASSEEPVLAYTLAVLNAFGAADTAEEGCFVVPDGSGALIRFNNQKYTAKTYSQLIYGTDTTAVPKTKGAVVEGVSLPMYGICKGENAMLAVAAEGDGSCYLCADTSGTGQSNTGYNRCYFKFLLRSRDQYYLGGDQLNPLDVYEKNLAHRTLRVNYYPLAAQDDCNADRSETLDYVDIAARYRQYLKEDMHVKQTAKADDAQLYIDLYGGCMKRKNVLGFPVFMKTAMTSFSEMQEILQKLSDAGADSMTVALNRWTDAGIEGEIDYKAKPSGTLGGKNDFKKLTDYMDSSNIAWYPVTENTAYYSGNGYYSLTDTAVRVSGSFARIVDYESAYGIPYGPKDTMSLLSPSKFPALFADLRENYRDAGCSSVSIGSLASKLYGDYGKKTATARDQTKAYLTEALDQLRSEVGAVLSEDPNAYMLPYTDTITDLPLYSSGFNLFDEEIPLCQLCLHGLIPYSTKAVNGSADAERLVLLAMAAGSNLRFDLLHAEISELKDTDFDVFFYAHADHWIENAAQYYLFSKEILRAASDSEIISYRRENDRITTRYANGTETVVDLQAGTVSLNGKTLRLSDYIAEGAVVFA
ncbi:MAG: hypothetical protein IK130_02245 [Oscillospiraceae bacterium]|nr:hypothetical protein [Oscillospiraceae bacterium]